MTHFNWMALRDRYLLKKTKTPTMTDERYCEIEALPERWAHTPRLAVYWISKQPDKKKAKAQYRLWLSQNGLLNGKEY